MRRARDYAAAFIVVLPTVWWAVATAAMSPYAGWNHDPRFFRLYQVPLTVLAWLSRGERYHPAEAVAMQDGMLALLMSAGVAALLVSSAWWQSSRAARVGWAILSALLPWWPLVQGLGQPEWFAAPSYVFLAGYVVTVVAAFTAPVSGDTRSFLFGVGLVSGVSLSMWRLERWEWLLAGDLVAAFVLLGYSLAQTTQHAARSRRTR